MPRLEAALQTHLRFYGPSETEFLKRLDEPSDSVAIEFEGREYVWHAPRASPSLANDFWGPTLTVIVEGENDEEAAEGIERVLSALSYRFDTPIGVAEYGRTDEACATATPTTHTAGSPYGRILSVLPGRIEIDADRPLRVALGHFREGRATLSPFYRLLAFWNALEAACGSEAERDEFIRQLPLDAGGWGESAWGPRPPGDDLVKYLRDASRNAVAHVIRRPGKAMVDPDLPHDRRRLSHDGWFLRGLVLAAIEHGWPDGVRVYGGKRIERIRTAR